MTAVPLHLGVAGSEAEERLVAERVPLCTAVGVTCPRVL